MDLSIDGEEILGEGDYDSVTRAMADILGAAQKQLRDSGSLNSYCLTEWRMPDGEETQATAMLDAQVSDTLLYEAALGVSQFARQWNLEFLRGYVVTTGKSKRYSNDGPEVLDGDLRNDPEAQDSILLGYVSADGNDDRMILCPIHHTDFTDITFGRAIMTWGKIDTTIVTAFRRGIDRGTGKEQDTFIDDLKGILKGEDSAPQDS